MGISETIESIYDSYINGQKTQVINQVQAYIDDGGSALSVVEYIDDLYGIERGHAIARLLIGRLLD